jgi:hypothetical protein
MTFVLQIGQTNGILKTWIILHFLYFCLQNKSTGPAGKRYAHHCGFLPHVVTLKKWLRLPTRKTWAGRILVDANLRRWRLTRAQKMISFDNLLSARNLMSRVSFPPLRSICA